MTRPEESRGGLALSWLPSCHGAHLGTALASFATDTNHKPEANHIFISSCLRAFVVALTNDQYAPLQAKCRLARKQGGRPEREEIRSLTGWHGSFDRRVKLGV